MEKRTVWIPIKAVVRIDVEVEEGLDKKEIFMEAVEKAYMTSGLHRLPSDDWMLDDDEIQGPGIELLVEDLVEDMY